MQLKRKPFMHWPVWGLPYSDSRRFCVVGLAVGSEACHLVVWEGTLKGPIGVVWAESLCLPAGWVLHGEVWQPLVMGQWLSVHMNAKGYRPEGVYLSLDDRFVAHHTVALAAGMSRDDVEFQLQAELQAMFSEEAQPMCVDFDVIDESVEPGEQLYLVHAVPRDRVQTMQRMAKAAGWSVWGVVPSRAAMALPCDAACLAALGAWRETAVNFLWHRSAQHLLLPRILWGRVALSAVSGMFLAVVAILVLTLWPDATPQDAADTVASAHAYVDAQQAYNHAHAMQSRGQAQMRWLQSSQNVSSQSWQWHRVLGQATQGVWVIRVHQQGKHWTVQGEALSPDHVRLLLEQLKTLDIWTQVPETQQLHILPARSRTGLPVWQFRLEADLKVGQ